MTDRLEGTHRDNIETRHATDKSAAHRLARLDDLDDYEVADGEPDPRGWNVRTQDGREVGTVESLICDPAAYEVRYLHVRAKHEVLGTEEDSDLLIPIGTARIDDDRDAIIIPHLPGSGFRGAPLYNGASVTADHENSVCDFYRSGFMGDREARDEELKDSRRFFGARRAGRESQPYLVRRKR